MKLKGKHVLLIIVFIFIVSLAYIIASTFSYTSLSFKPFFESEYLTKNDESQHITYCLTNDERIVFAEKNNGKININKIKDINVDPITVLSFDSTNIGYYDFYIKGKYAYFFYNNNDNVKIIDFDYYEFTDVKLLENSLTVVNGYSDVLYAFKDNNFYELDVIDNISTIKTTYVLPNDILNIKNIEFINKNEIIIATYESKLYSYNLINNKKILISDFHSSYYIDNETLYFTHSSNKSKLTISYFKQENVISFDVKACDFLTMKVRENYMYLISDKEINKVSIEREKRHENMQMSSYENLSYNLSEILIINEKLMYLPMIEYSNDNDSHEYLYTYHLYRYKI